MKPMNVCACLVLCVLLITGAAYGQGVGTSGELVGTVTDNSGAVVVNAAVLAIESDKGIEHKSATDNRGQYRFAGLPPAEYSVTVASPGFASAIQKLVVVTLGETSTVDFQLRVSPQVESYDVTAEPPVVDTARASQSNTVDQMYIDDLPINRRDYLAFTLLMPGVSDSTSIADDRDLRERQVPQSGLSFYGSNGRGNSVTVDGGWFNGYSGFVMANVSQEAVQEFQINRSNYSAQLGGASGASINIVTKSGTNHFKGTVYGFFRNDALDARDPFAFTQALTPGGPFSLNAQGQPVKNALSRQQFGGTVGFPLKKDKTFLFVSYEGLHQTEQQSVPLLTNSNIFAPTAAQSSIFAGLAARGTAMVPCLTNPANPTGPAINLPATTCAGTLQGLLTVSPNANPVVGAILGAQRAQFQSQLNGFLVNQMEINGGLLPFPVEQHLGSVRLDHQFSDRTQSTLRYVAAHLSETDPSQNAQIGFSNGFSQLTWTSSLQASVIHTFNATTVNELRAQWTLNQFNFIPTDPGGPSIAFQGFAVVGRNLTLPNISTERDYEMADNFTRILGHHTLQLGVDEILRGNRTESDTFFAGDFLFGTLPGGIVSPCLAAPGACGLATAPTTINSLQSFGLGLPQTYIQAFGNPDVVTMMPLTGVYAQDQWAVKPNLTFTLGLRYDLDSRAFIHTDYRDFGPRASFAWDPFKDHKTAIRGGYGIYYAPILLQVDSTTDAFRNVNNQRLISELIVPLNGFPGGGPNANAIALFNGLFSQGRILCGHASANGQGCVTAANLAPFGLTPSNSGPLPPLSVTFNAAPNFRSPYSQQASFGIEREMARGFSISANYVYVHTVALTRVLDQNLLPGAPITSNVPGTNGLPFQNWGAPQCLVPVNNPCFVNPLIEQNNFFNSTAGALYQGGILEFKKRFSNHYTLLASYTYSKALDDVPDFTYWASSQLAPGAERALSSFDQRHKISVAGVIESPFKSLWLSGFQFSPIISYNSARPFNLYTGTDVNGDHINFSDRPPGVGRNTGIGPDYIDWNMRLSRSFKIAEKSSLQFMIEAFNIVNRTNYSSVNDVVSPTMGPPFNVHGTVPNLAGQGEQPLNFASDSNFPNNKREIQIGARLSF
jgi:hypothetical protein